MRIARIATIIILLMVAVTTAGCGLGVEVNSENSQVAAAKEAQKQVIESALKFCGAKKEVEKAKANYLQATLEYRQAYSALEAEKQHEVAKPSAVIKTSRQICPRTQNAFSEKAKNTGGG